MGISGGRRPCGAVSDGTAALVLSASERARKGGRGRADRPLALSLALHASPRRAHARWRSVRWAGGTVRNQVRPLNRIAEAAWSGDLGTESTECARNPRAEKLWHAQLRIVSPDLPTVLVGGPERSRVLPGGGPRGCSQRARAGTSCPRRGRSTDRIRRGAAAAKSSRAQCASAVAARISPGAFVCVR